MQGCSGIGDQNFTETPYNFVDDGLQTVLTSEGFEFLYENRRTILGLLFDVDENGWVEIPIQDFQQPETDLSAMRDVSLGSKSRPLNSKLSSAEPHRHRHFNQECSDAI